VWSESCGRACRFDRPLPMIAGDGAARRRAVGALSTVARFARFGWSAGRGPAFERAVRVIRGSAVACAAAPELERTAAPIGSAFGSRLDGVRGLVAGMLVRRLLRLVDRAGAGVDAPRAERFGAATERFNAFFSGMLLLAATELRAAPLLAISRSPRVLAPDYAEPWLRAGTIFGSVSPP
jgi:hypothetical protein